MKELKILAELGELPKITEFLEQLLEGRKDVYAILLSAEEIFVNIASYAYENSGEVFVSVEISGDEFVMEFSDFGKEHNPLNAKEPKVLDNPLDMEQGGFGIFLVKKTMDEVDYLRKNGKNILRMKKTIQ